MALLNFPSNPTTGQIYTIGTNSWVWTGSAWIKYTSSDQSPITVNTQTGSTSTVTGALVVTGGIGVGGSINAGTTSTVAGAEIITTGTVETFAVTSLYAGTDTAVSANIGIVTVWNTSTLQTVTDRGSETSNIIRILNTGTSLDSGTGALVVDGGVGVGGNINVDGILRVTNTTQALGTGTGALVVDGGAAIAGRLYAESVKIADTILDSSQVYINNTATTIVDLYPITQFRSAKYLIQIDEGSGETADFQVIEIILLVDNAGTVYATEYGVVSSNGEMGEFAADVQADDYLRLYFTAFYPTEKVIRVLRTGMSV